MKDKWSIKKVLESQADVHEMVANQSNSELLSSSPTPSIGPPRIQIKVQIAYDLSTARPPSTRPVRPSPVLCARSPTPAMVLISAHHAAPATCTPRDK
jgi:hypothetical protein